MKAEVKQNTKCSNKKIGLYRKYYKRLIDFILSLIAIVVLSPVLLILAILVRIKLGSPVIFKQQRPGLNEKIFILYKFRTMTDERDKFGEFLPDGERLTEFGKFLRSTSLDELPELFNILIGDMSIVGPRPQLLKDMVFMTKEQRNRHSVLPGLTGLAQISGRNSITWDEKLSYDLKYVSNITFMGDCRIILSTFIKVLKREGVSSEGMEISEDLGDYLLKENKISKSDYCTVIEELNNIE